MESSVLFKSPDGTAIVIDIPRSLEEAQVLPGQDITRRIASATPRDTPWQVPEPKKDTAQYVSPSVAIAELMTLESVKAALDAVRASYDGPWYLPRVTRKQAGDSEPIGAELHADVVRKRKHEPSSHPLEQSNETGPYIPEKSHHLQGTVESQREAFLQNAPQFDLIVLDPPWPSRSVKRKSNSCM
ncbi:hypothetical protein RRF57_008929 [Xylaria bambusicola]|uniref:Uncharacterized protein n=1 Tax=Xylaria bambusicola TaxID=326684 RepID=A0AAN7Z155_9PEZI